MSRIGGFGNLTSGQLGAIRRIQDLSVAINQNTKRLSTLRRINSAADDPAGSVKASLLEQELSAAQAASRSVTRANAQLSTADAAAGEILNGLQEARSLALAAAGGSLSSSEVAANQIEVDTILRNVDSLAQTQFAGRRLLDGSADFRTSGVDSTEIADVDVLDKLSDGDITVSIDVTTQATQATDSFTDGTLTADATVIVDGPNGSTSISLDNGDDTQAITDAFNAATHLTGITATRIDANQVDFATIDYGSAASISIQATTGTFDTTAGTTVTGTDAVATVNGQQFTADGTTFNVNTTQFSAQIEVDTAASGTLTAFTVSGEGLNYVIGPSPTDTARIGLPKLTTTSLGGVTGKLNSLISGGANTLTGGRATEALTIIDDAIDDVTRSRAIIGGFQNYTLDSSSRVISSTIENLTSSLSAVQDADVAVETALLANNQLLRQSAFEALSITSLNSRGVLNLLRNTANRF